MFDKLSPSRIVEPFFDEKRWPCNECQVPAIADTRRKVRDSTFEHLDCKENEAATLVSENFCYEIIG